MSDSALMTAVNPEQWLQRIRVLMMAGSVQAHGQTLPKTAGLSQEVARRAVAAAAASDTTRALASSIEASSNHHAARSVQLHLERYGNRVQQLVIVADRAFRSEWITQNFQTLDEPDREAITKQLWNEFVDLSLRLGNPPSHSIVKRLPILHIGPRDYDRFWADAQNAGLHKPEFDTLVWRQPTVIDAEIAEFPETLQRLKDEVPELSDMERRWFALMRNEDRVGFARRAIDSISDIVEEFPDFDYEVARRLVIRHPTKAHEIPRAKEIAQEIVDVVPHLMQTFPRRDRREVVIQALKDHVRGDALETIELRRKLGLDRIGRRSPLGPDRTGVEADKMPTGDRAVGTRDSQPPTGPHAAGGVNDELDAVPKPPAPKVVRRRGALILDTDSMRSGEDAPSRQRSGDVAPSFLAGREQESVSSAGEHTSRSETIGDMSRLSKAREQGMENEPRHDRGLEQMF